MYPEICEFLAILAPPPLWGSHFSYIWIPPLSLLIILPTISLQLNCLCWITHKPYPTYSLFNCQSTNNNKWKYFQDFRSKQDVCQSSGSFLFSRHGLTNLVHSLRVLICVITLCDKSIVDFIKSCFWNDWDNYIHFLFVVQLLFEIYHLIFDYWVTLSSQKCSWKQFCLFLIHFLKY